MSKPHGNITELATRLNLSKGTVSRILNDPRAPFAVATRQRVLSLADEMGYRPNPIARALATGRTESVALWIRNLRTSYRAMVAQSFETKIEAQSYRLLIRLYGHDDKGDMLSPGMSESVDGIVTHGPPPAGWLRSAGSGPRSVPIVHTGNIADPDALDWVAIDLSRGSQEAVEHLLATGRRRVAHLTTLVGSSDPRLQSYLSTMADAGYKPEVITATGDTRDVLRRTLREYVTAHGCPEALFCYNDDAAIAAYRALCDLGRRVPDDIALVGCDGIEDTEYLATPLTTLVTPVTEMCRLAWQYLKRRMEEPDAPPQRTVLQPTLVVRESSRV